MKIQESEVQVEVGIALRDHLSLHLLIQDGVISSAQLTGTGCTQMIKLMQEWRGKLKGDLSALSLPQGEDHCSILMRELVLKAQGKWVYPYQEEELCHCRAVPVAKVDSAIIGGCHSVYAVARETSAGTACGTCRPDTEKILKYRLGR